MSCLVPLVLAACLLDGEKVEVRADLGKQVGGDVRWSVQGQRIEPVFGMLEIGAGGELRRGVEVRYGLRHTSFANTGKDKGENRVFIGLVWRPFR